MSCWLAVPADDATPDVARATAPWTKQGLPTPSVIAPMKLRPNVLRAVLQMNSAVTFGGSTLGRRREELVATFVSALNECFY